MSALPIVETRPIWRGAPFSVLVATRPESWRGRYARSSAASIGAHLTLGLLIVYAGAPAALPVQAVIDTTLVYIAPDQEQRKPPAREPERPVDVRTLVVNAPLRGFQTIAALSEIPTGIPPVDLTERFDPRDYSGRGVEGGIADGVDAPPLPPGVEIVYAVSVVEEMPELLSAPPLLYPPLLQQAGIQGRVVLEFVVDAGGRVEPGTMRVVSSSHVAFEQPSVDMVRRGTFRPGRVNGRAVRVLVRLPVNFALVRAGE